MAISQRLEIAKAQLESAREYTLEMLDGLSEEDWFAMPQLAPTNIAWQVGHIAMAQYGLTLFRQRGRAEIDSELMSGKLRKKFMKGTTPDNDRATMPAPDEILGALHRVNEQMMQEIDGFDGPGLDEPADMPTAGFATRYGSLLFAAHHEMLHAGQIGLIRRLLGNDPIR